MSVIPALLSSHLISGGICYSAGGDPGQERHSQYQEYCEYSPCYQGMMCSWLTPLSHDTTSNQTWYWLQSTTLHEFVVHLTNTL